MQDHPVVPPAGRHMDRPLHPGLADAVPGRRVGREIPMVGSLQAMVSEAVGIPGGRDPDPDILPGPGAGFPRLEIPGTVQAHLVAVRLFQTIRETLGRSEPVGEVHPGREDGREQQAGKQEKAGDRFHLVVLIHAKKGQDGLYPPPHPAVPLQTKTNYLSI